MQSSYVTLAGRRYKGWWSFRSNGLDPAPFFAVLQPFASSPRVTVCEHPRVLRATTHLCASDDEPPTQTDDQGNLTGDGTYTRECADVPVRVEYRRRQPLESGSDTRAPGLYDKGKGTVG